MANRYESVNAQLAQIPGYLDAVRKASPGTRGQVARQFAAMHGIQAPSGAVDERGQFYDPNASHWYDPQVLGPIAVGSLATAGAAGALGGAGVLGSAGGSGAAGGLSAAAGGGGPLAATSVPTGLGFGGLTAAQAYGGAAPVADYLGNKPSILRRVGNAVTGGGESGASPWLQAALAALSGIPALVAANKNKPTAEELAMQQQVKDMLAHQQRRTQYQDPLYQAVSQLAMSRLPTGVQRDMGEM